AIFLIVTVIPYAFACVLWAPLPLHLRYKLTVGWPRLAIWGARVICGIRWQVKGWENLPEGPAVILSKHQSAWETLFFPAYMPREVCFVYKKELHMVPFFGWGLALLRMIAIDRSKGRDAFEQVVAQGRKRMDEGRWPLLFPEGTRVPPGQAGRFKMGGALLASRTGAKVIPVAHNAGECWRRNAFVKRPGLVTLSIGPAIESQGLTPEELNQKVQGWIEGEMRRLNPERYV
nr:1-acyl-sn-glycerol-3-phosphate acyltransferase [Achromobacter sp.]